MKTYNIKIHDSTSLDDQLEKSIKAIYNNLKTPSKMNMTVWLKLYELPKVETNDVKILRSELETIEEEVLHLRKELNKRGNRLITNTIKNLRYKEEEYERLLKEFNEMYKKLKVDNTIEKHINTKYYILLNELDKKNFLVKSKEEIKNKVSELCFKKSGLTIDEITKHVLTEVEYRPISGTSYIDLPEKLKNKKALINIKNLKDNECFRWCHLAHLNPVSKNAERISKYKDKINTVDYTGIEFPVKVDDIPKIEKMNEGIRFNVFGYKLGVQPSRIYPLYNSKEQTPDICRLLLLEDEEKGMTHYVYIKDFSKLLNSESKHKCRKYFCDYCLQKFSRDNILRRHKEVCLELNGTQSIRMPSKKNASVKFTNYKKTNKSSIRYLCRFRMCSKTN